MNQLSDISDEDFVPFLQNLGVDTYKKSFEWMLNDPDFSGVLRWMYHNLDANNALTAREEYRYAELEKKGKLLSPNDLEAKISSIQDQFVGLCLPGDKNGLEDIKMDIAMQKERLSMLTKHENILQECTTKNKEVKEDLILELSQLNAAQKQCSEDESVLSEECTTLAEEVENITESVLDVISDTLEQYTNTQTDAALSSKFFTFGPFESYRQSQALFRSHFDLYTTKKLCKHHDAVSVEELRAVLAEAKVVEERLTQAAFAYVESKAELLGEQAKVALVANFTPVHQSQITVATMEAQSALELLEQEEAIATQQLQSAIKEMVDSRTKMAVDTTFKAALAVREQVLSSLSLLVSSSSSALSCDRLLYAVLRYELRTAEELLQFAQHLRAHRDCEHAAAATRVELMSEICMEQAQCQENLQNTDTLLQALCKLLNIPNTNDISVIVKVYNELKNNMKELRANVQDQYQKKEEHLKTLSDTSRKLLDARSLHSTPLVSSLVHSLTDNIKQTEQHVLNFTETFTNVKKRDKQNIRKFWQWFLTDHQKLMTVFKDVSPKSYQ